MSAHETLGLLLVREGLISRPQLYDALRLQRQTGRLLGTCLLSLGHMRSDALLAMLSKQLAIPALPSGTLNRASPEAVRRVSREIAFRLRILPYSWDGQMLGVAVADGRVLGQLHEVAYHARAAVGAYVALETEIDAVLRSVYPDPPSASPTRRSGDETDNRPRPPQTRKADGAVLQPMVPTPLSTPTSAQAVRQPPAGPPQRALVAQPPAPASATPRAAGDAGAVPAVDEALERVSFFDAVERLYEAGSAHEIGRMAGRALLNYFSRVLVIISDGDRFRVVGHAGLYPQKLDIPEDAVPLTVSKLSRRELTYGMAAMDVKTAELGGVFGFEPGTTVLIATIGARVSPRLVILADNGEANDLYDDLHDIELLFKEAETGLGMLLDKAE